MAQWGRANNFYLALIEQDWAGTHLRDDTGNLTLMWLRAGSIFGYHLWQQVQGETLTLAESISTDRLLSDLPDVRLVLAFTNGLLILLAYHWLTRLWDWRVGFLAATLLALDPFFLSESRMIRSEALYTSFMGLSVITLLLYLKERRRSHLILSGVLGGLAISSKLTGLFLIGFAPLALLTLYLLPPLGRGVQSNQSARPPDGKSTPLLSSSKQWLIATTIWLTSYLLTMVALWPALWVRPLAIVNSMWRTINASGIEGKSDERFFQGILWENLPTYYYLVALPFRTTPLVWLGLLLAMVALLVGLYRWLRPTTPRQAPSSGGELYLGLLLLFAILYTALFSIAANKTDRYILTAIWALDVVAAVGLIHALTWLRLTPPKPSLEPAETDIARADFDRLSRRGRWVRRGVGVAIALLLLWQGYTVLTIHPYYIAYYNPLLGGHAQAATVFQLGYGAGVKQAMDYLNQQPNATSLRVVCGTNEPRCALPFVGQTWQRRTLDSVNGRWVLADYVLMYREQQQRQMYPDGLDEHFRRQTPAYVSQVNGVAYAWVYAAPQMPYSGLATNLAGLGTLLGFAVDAPSELTASDSVAVRAVWQNEPIVSKSFHVQLIDPAGYVWTEATLQPVDSYADLTTVNKAIIESTATLTLPAGLVPATYFVRFGFRRTDQQPDLFLPLRLPLDETASLTVTAIDQRPPDVSRLGLPLDVAVTDDLRLLGVAMSPPVSGEIGGRLWLPLLWQATTDIERDYVTLLRLLDSQENEVTFWLGRPVQSSQTTAAWQAEQVIRDVWDLTLPTDIAAGQYQLELALFDAATQAEVNRLELLMLEVRN